MRRLTSIALVLLTLAAGAARGDEPLAADPLRAIRDELARQRAELEAQRALLESATAPSDVEAKEPMLRLYGFMDMGVQRSFNVTPSLVAFVPSLDTTFAFGNFDLYVDAQPFADWSAFAELRLTYDSSGNDIASYAGQPYTRPSSVVYDYSSASGGWSQIRYGGLVVERAYLQWRHWDWLGVRVGEFLTPFGIWNIDHGSPTLISLMLPQFEVSEMFPTHQVGVELFGSWSRAPWELRYFLYLSNGRTPTAVSLSDESKMLGGRVELRLAKPVRLAFGASGFIGHYDDKRRTVTSVDPYTVQVDTAVEFDERGAGGDVSLDVGRLRLRGEVAFRQVIYIDGRRDLQWAQPGIYVPNHNEWDGYLLAAYQLPWLGLEPYLYAELYHYPSPLGDGQINLSAGLNIHFNAVAQLKVQFMDFRSFDDPGRTKPSPWKGDTQQIAARVVLAF